MFGRRETGRRPPRASQPHTQKADDDDESAETNVVDAASARESLAEGCVRTPKDKMGRVVFSVLAMGQNPAPPPCRRGVETVYG